MKNFFIVIGLFLLMLVLGVLYFLATDFLINTLDITWALISIFGLVVILLVLAEIIKIKILRLFEDEDLFKQEQDTDNKEV
jgi:cytochrome c biogenesis protein CcdA